MLPLPSIAAANRKLVRPKADTSALVPLSRSTEYDQPSFKNQSDGAHKRHAQCGRQQQVAEGDELLDLTRHQIIATGVRIRTELPVRTRKKDRLVSGPLRFRSGSQAAKTPSSWQATTWVHNYLGSR